MGDSLKGLILLFADFIDAVGESPRLTFRLEVDLALKRLGSKVRRGERDGVLDDGEGIRVLLRGVEGNDLKCGLGISSAIA